MALTDVSLFNILISILMLIGGFLLNRVFLEIDKLSAANVMLNNIMLKDYVAKDEFQRHADSEIRLIEKMADEINKRFDKLDILLEAVRVKQFADHTHHRESNENEHRG